MVDPARGEAEFVWRMEDVLEVYTRPYDSLRPQVCMDKTSSRCSGTPGRPADGAREEPDEKTPSTSEAGLPTCSCSPSRLRAGVGWT